MNRLLLFKSCPVNILIKTINYHFSHKDQYNGMAPDTLIKLMNPITT